MKNVVSLVLIVALIVAGWMNRDKLQRLLNRPNSVEQTPAAATPAETQVNAPPGTPHPARESQALALQVYPGLRVLDSPLNKKFLTLYADAQQNNPALLSRPDWPIHLAERAMVEIGGAPLPVPRATPQGNGSNALTGTSLDQRAVPASGRVR